MSESNKGGYTDQPALKDQFNIESYISGLTEFVKTCNTPITMAIQGDWGTGKTSIMQMVYERLGGEKNKNLVMFNTWQFSQFNMGDRLPLMMMTKLVNSVANSNEQAKEIANKLVRLVGDVVLGRLSGGSATMDGIQSAASITEFVDTIDRLKENFTKLVEQRAGKDGRVVFFIDDLDRLEPGRAVELLEVLKVFLDCEKCVFVLAIDYGVVTRGVKEKYGADFSEEKGKDFFDKIIQVPFKMPVANYDISNYVRTGLGSVGIPVSDNDLGTFESLIKDSIGNNPRSMKRLFNSFLLLSKIAKTELLNDSHRRSILFALLCMQSKFEGVYNHLICNRNIVKAEHIEALKDAGNPLFADLKMPKETVDAFINFAEDFSEVIDTDGIKGIGADELLVFREVLDFSAITANNSSGESDTEGEYRWRHKDWCRYYLGILRDKYPGITFKEYFTRTHDKASWWLYTPDGAQTPSGHTFFYQFRLDPTGSGTALQSALTIEIYKEGGRYSLDDVLADIGPDPLSCLGIAPVRQGDYLSYKSVVTFETATAIENRPALDVILKSFEQIKKYYVTE